MTGPASRARIFVAALVVDPFGAKPLRIGSRYLMRQPTSRAITGRARRRDHRHLCGFDVCADGRARWRDGVEPSAATLANVRRVVNRRFCGERRA